MLPLSDDTRKAFAFAAEAGLPVDHPDARWLVLGWGAAGFYTTVGSYADLSTPVIWRAATGDTAVLRLDLAGDVSRVEGLDWMDASPAQIAALRDIALQAMERDAVGRPIAVPPAPWGQTHVFYRAKGRFHLFHTCNAWLGEALRAAGLKFGVWTPTPQAVAFSLWWNQG